MTNAFDQLREYHALTSFAARARAFPDSDKPTFVHARAAARESLGAAQASWSVGVPAPALMLVTRGFDEALALARTATKSDVDRPLGEVLDALAIDEERRAEVVAVAKLRASIDLPQTTEEVTAAHVDAFPRIAAAARVLLQLVEPYGLSPEDVRRTRLQRLVRSASIAALVVTIVGLIIAAQFRVRATCSAIYGTSYDAPNVLDLHPDSEWLLPDQTAGWLDLWLSPARTVSRVRMINAHNSIHNDRATKNFRIELWRKGVMVHWVDASFPEFTPTPGWTTFDLGGAYKADRIRFVVLSWHLSGGGFGEIRFD